MILVKNNLLNKRPCPERYFQHFRLSFLIKTKTTPKELYTKGARWRDFYIKISPAIFLYKVLS